jgi:hypothetical protein
MIKMNTLHDFKIPRFSFAILFALLLLMSGQIRAQKVGTTSFQFLKVIPDARITAIGGAAASLSHQSEALYTNPAALYAVEGFDLTFSHVQWFLDSRIYGFTAAYHVSTLGTVGLIGLYHDYGSIEETRVDLLDFNADGTFHRGFTGETLSPGSMVLGLAFARAITDKFSFGLTVKMAREDLVLEKVSTVIFDGGLQYNTGFRSIKLGAVIRHFGQEAKFVEEKFPLPQTFELGISGYIFGPGTAFLFTPEEHQLLLSYSILHPRDYAQQQGLGLEYGWRNHVFLRAGYRLNFDEEGLSLGFGLRLARIRVDYSYERFGDFLDAVNRFSLGFSL